MRLVAFVLLLTSVFATKNVTHGLLRERSMNTTNRQLDLKGDILKKLIASMTSSKYKVKNNEIEEDLNNIVK